LEPEIAERLFSAADEEGVLGLGEGGGAAEAH
jgi:hypothetical protein